jgi:outer membrane protein assembly factor BamB
MRRFCSRGGLVLGLALVLAGCGRQTPGDKDTDPSKSVKAGGDDGADCCEIDRSKLLVLQGAAGPAGTRASPTFGGGPLRNMVNLVDKGLPAQWSVEEGKFTNVKWAVKLGDKAYGGPVIAGGRVFVGTNNTSPRDPAIKDKKKAVLMCFAEADGKFLWQTMHDIPAEDTFEAVRYYGLVSTPAVDGDRVYYVTPSGEVVCVEAATGKRVWLYDMRNALKVHPFHCCNCSPLVVGERVFLVTSNGTDDEGKIPSPKAPSFIALSKQQGTLLWQSNLPGDRIIEGQWSNPAYAEANGKPQVIFPGGDCWLYALEPDTGNLIWRCNCDPQRPKAEPGERLITNYMIATPAVHDNKVYIGLGVYPDHGSTPRHSYVVCVDITKKGDVSPVDLNAQNPKNKDSALVWAFGGPVMPKPAKGRFVYFGSTISTCAVADGRVYIAEERGYVHCLDAKTGQRQWEHDALTGIWGSPYLVDGKVYIGSDDGEIMIFSHPNGKLDAKIPMEEQVQSTPVACNGVLYIMTRSKLYAIASGGTAKQIR